MAVLNNGLRPEIPAWCPSHFSMLIQVMTTNGPTLKAGFDDDDDYGDGDADDCGMLASGI